MGLCCRKPVQNTPCVRLNLSKGDTDCSIGGHSGTVAVNEQRVFQTVGVPVSGVSYHTKIID